MRGWLAIAGWMTLSATAHAEAVKIERWCGSSRYARVAPYARSEAFRLKPLATSLHAVQSGSETCFEPEMELGHTFDGHDKVRLPVLCGQPALQRFARALTHDEGHVTLDVTCFFDYADGERRRKNLKFVLRQPEGEQDRSLEATKESDPPMKVFRVRPAEIRWVDAGERILCWLPVIRIDDPDVPARYFIGPKAACQDGSISPTMLEAAILDPQGFVRIASDGRPLDRTQLGSREYFLPEFAGGPVLFGEILPVLAKPRTLP